ncbi:MAG: hypothetical protein AMS24_00955 [Chlamydiae bacterium SM23_39]|nr:MAG: hypothetical protein AMS24_00955 [Chlamydiae bacterium SM23_39]
MIDFLHRTFGIFPDEKKTVFRFIRLTIFWACSSSIGEILSISLFVKNVGAVHLPAVYMMTAIVLMFAASFLIYLIRISTTYKVFFRTTYISAIFYVIFSIILVKSPSIWCWFFLQIFSYVILASLITTYWNFLDQYHDLQDAKRIYGLYNTSFFVGCMLAGGLITIFYERIGASPLFILSAILLFFALIETYQINKKVIDIEDDIVEGFFSKGKRGILSIIRNFYKSKFSIFLVIMSLIVQLLITTTEFSYMKSLEEIIISSTSVSIDVIPKFLGKCNLIISFINILIGMFFYGRLVKRFRISNIVIIPTLVFLFLYSRWMINISMFIVILAIFSIDGILDTIEDNNFNILINAVPPKIRKILRIVNDFLFEPIGLFVSSLFLIFLSSYSLILGFILSISFFVISIIVKYFYPKAILRNLKENVIHFERKCIDWINSLNRKEKKEIFQDIEDVLNKECEVTKFLAFELLLKYKNKKIDYKFIYSAEKLSIDGKIIFLKLLDKSFLSNEKLIIDMVKKWEKYSSEILNKWCNLYLAKRGYLQIEKTKKDITNKDLFLKAIAIFSLRNSFSIRERELAKREAYRLLKDKDEDRICMGIDILSDDRESFDEIIKLLDHENLKIKKKAAEAISNLSEKDFSSYSLKIIEVMKKTPDNKIRTFCLNALYKISDPFSVKEIILAASHFRPSEKRDVEFVIINMGKKVVDILMDILKDVSLNYCCRILASKVLGRISLVKLKKELKDIIEVEIKRAYFYFFSGHLIQNRYPYYDLIFLKKALLNGFQANIDFIIHLLGASRSLEDCDLLVHSLHSKNEKIHADAIETLEQNCDPKIFVKIYPLIENIPWIERKKAYSKINEKYTLPSLSDLLMILNKSSSMFDKAIVEHYTSLLDKDKFFEKLKDADSLKEVAIR